MLDWVVRNSWQPTLLSACTNSLTYSCPSPIDGHSWEPCRAFPFLLTATRCIATSGSNRKISKLTEESHRRRPLRKPIGAMQSSICTYRPRSQFLLTTPSFLRILTPQLHQEHRLEWLGELIPESLIDRIVAEPSCFVVLQFHRSPAERMPWVKYYFDTEIVREKWSVQYKMRGLPPDNMKWWSEQHIDPVKSYGVIVEATTCLPSLGETNLKPSGIRMFRTLPGRTRIDFRRLR